MTYHRLITVEMGLLRFLWISQVLCVLIANTSATNDAQSDTGPPQDQMPKKVLIVLTSTSMISGTEIPTGWYLPELAHPYKALVNAGFEMDSVSPKGGKAPVDPASVEAYKDDFIVQWFQNDPNAQALVDNTKVASEINPSNYIAVFYPGGHGPMFDLASDVDIAQITSQIFQDGGVVAAVCHGPAGLIPVTVAGGDSIVAGRKVTSFSNAEEDAGHRSSVMPFLLETKLKDLGADYSAAGLFQQHVVVDGRLITGQNPASALPLAEAMIKLLE